MNAQLSESRRGAPNLPAGMATRRAAVDLVRAVLVSQHALDDAIAAATTAGALGKLEPRDRAHARAIVATTLRRLGQIDAVLTHFLTKGWPEKCGRLREIMRTSAAQLLFMDTPPHAVVSIAVSLAKADHEARRFEKLVNAVLRRVSEQGPALVAAQDAARLNTPDWLWRSWIAAYGETDARAIAAAHLIEAPLDISVKADAAVWAEKLSAVVLPTGTLRRPSAGRVDELTGFADGGWWVQDCAAALPARMLGDVRGKRVLDLCAAPGGKTAQLAAAGAHVTALDASESRLLRLKSNLARLRLEAEVVVADAETWTPADGALFDAVLLDAPCTATGTIRRHPDIPYLKRESDVGKLADLQGRLLKHSARLVRPGGALVYCTCSLQPEEGSAQAEALLRAEAGLKLVPLAAGEVAGMTDWISPQGYLRTLPFHGVSRPSTPETVAATGLDGFFAARFVRTG